MKSHMLIAFMASSATLFAQEPRTPPPIPPELGKALPKIYHTVTREKVEQSLGSEWIDVGHEIWNSRCGSSYISREHPGIQIDIWYRWSGTNKSPRPADTVIQLPQITRTSLVLPADKAKRQVKPKTTR